MTNHQAALPHGSIWEVLPEIFFVTGTMRNEFFGAMWQFSRNMVIVREGERLTLVNSIRLDEAGLATLETLGRVTDVVRLGDMHGVDDAFYIDRYGARLWALPGNSHSAGPQADRTLVPTGELPLAGCTLFDFRTTKRPEGILRLDAAGGTLIACDSLQNWVEADEFCTPETAAMMEALGFFAPANVGPAWLQANEPRADDWVRLKQVPFTHILCGHGSPLLETAQADFHATFARLFGV